MIYIYVIRSQRDSRLYVGMTNNLDRRLKEHNLGHTRSTKAYRPWRIIRSEVFESRLEARKREKYLKSGYGKKWLKEKYKWSHSSAG